MELHGSLNMIGYGLAAIGSAIGVGLIFACLVCITLPARARPQPQRPPAPVAEIA